MAKLAADIDGQIERAVANARDFYVDEAAASIRYVPAEDMYVLILRSGRRVAVPREDIQYVAEADPESAADVVLDMLDSAVWWPKLDVALTVKSFADGFFGDDRWLKMLAERGMPLPLTEASAA